MQQYMLTGQKNLETATFGAGCFWGVEEQFRQLPGVSETVVGYTGHAEAVQIKYDPAKIDFEKLLDVFWNGHNPTQYHRQGPDIGSQYRSVIFFNTPEQEIAARKSKEALEKSGQYSKPIATEIVPVAPFYKAEEYHQKYFLKNGGGSCHI